MAIAIVLAALLWLLAEFIAAVVRLVKTGSIAKPKAVKVPVAQGRESTKVPGFVESIDPKVPPKGYAFQDVVTPAPGTPVRPGVEIEVTTTVTAPNGATGTMSRGLNPSTGEVVFHYAFLDGIPKDLRMVATTPEMVPGKGTPLEAYMSLRQLKLLEERAGSVSGPRGVFGTGPRKLTLSTIINKRTLAELATAELKKVPTNEAILSTHSVQYANNSVIQGGGRIANAKVVDGYRTAASNELSAAELGQYNIPADYKLLTGFDIELHIVPADAPPPFSGRPPIVTPPADVDQDQQ